jgi:hypothetical protein
MTAFRNLVRITRAGVLVAAVLTTACGGGGGGSSSGSGSTGSSSGGGSSGGNPVTSAYTLSTTSVSQTRSILDVNPVFTEITVTIPDPTKVPYGIGGQYTDTGLVSVIYDPTSMKLTLYFKIPAGVAPGTYNDTITIGVCDNERCTERRAGTVSTITAKYTLTAATLPSYTVSASTVNVTALAGDTAQTPPVDLLLSVTNPAPFTPAGFGTTTTTNGVYSALYTANSFSPLRIEVTMKPAYTLAPGTYTDTVNIQMCLYYDYGCQNRLTVTPSTVTVNYTITDTVPGPAGFTSKLTNARANDVAWDSTRGILYLSVPSDAPEHASTITEFNPATGAFGASIPAGTNPNLLALSDDNQFLYVADNAAGEIRRFTLGPLAPDITIALGNDSDHPSAYPRVAWDLQVAPGQPHVIAVKRQIVQFSPGDRGVVVYDDAVMRPTVWEDGGGYLQWGAGATRLYTSGGIATVDASGVTFLSSYPSVSGHITMVGNRMFGDFGQVTDTSTGTSLGPLALDGYYYNIASDKTLGRVYLLTNSQTTSGASQIETFDAATLTLIGKNRLPRYQIQSNSVARATRYASNGLAIVTGSHEVVLVTGPLIAP